MKTIEVAAKQMLQMLAHRVGVRHEQRMHVLCRAHLHARAAPKLSSGNRGRASHRSPGSIKADLGCVVLCKCLISFTTLFSPRRSAAGRPDRSVSVPTSARGDASAWRIGAGVVAAAAAG